MKIYVINPENGKPETIEKWSKQPVPTRAQLLAIDTGEKTLLLLSKKYMRKKQGFNEAQAASAAFHPKGTKGLTFRCPTRKECIDIHDAQYYGLDEAVRLTGGNLGRDYAKFLFTWTGDGEMGPETGIFAWSYSGTFGIIHFDGILTKNLVLPVTLMEKPQ